MEPRTLMSIVLAITEQRSLDAVLSTIVSAVSSQPDVALARVWLCEADALVLRASTGRPLDPASDWSRIDGAFRRIPLSSPLKIAHIARTGQPIRIDRLVEDGGWIQRPEWAAAERLQGFAGRPLLFHGNVHGVLGVFHRAEINDDSWEWLGTLSDAAAIAVANARAHEEAESLRRTLELERDYLREEVRDAGAFGDILGRSAALMRVLGEVDIVASTDTAVLVLGESGTGKELVARAIHQRSRRAPRPLVKVNCGSIPRELFESEFFGHVRGSFTGAVRDRIGRFQLADGGGLFLDEVGEIPLDLQAKLLRVLQEGEFERVGDDTTRRVNVRMIAATNRDLQREVAEGRFRLDLFYRLGVFPIVLPPLRDRREDIPDLLAHFVRQCCGRLHLSVPRLPVREIERARAYDWPGNIRELQNVVERAVILARGGTIELPIPEELPLPPPTFGALTAPPQTEDVITERAWRALERANIMRALERAHYQLWGSGGAADLLGINAGTLSSRLRKLGIRASELKRRSVRNDATISADAQEQVTGAVHSQ